MYAAIGSVHDWRSEIISVHDRVKDEAQFWLDNRIALNGFHFVNQNFSVALAELAGDASGEGFYIAKVSDQAETLLLEAFSEKQRLESSTWRECFGLWKLYSSEQAKKFQDCRICHRTDNQGTVAVFSIGSPVLELQLMAEDVFAATCEYRISLEVVWNSRDQPTMVLMDKGSHGPWRHWDGFGLDEETIKFVLDRGVSLDGFASAKNCVCAAYFFKGFEVEALGKDFFCQDLKEDQIYLIHTHPSEVIPALCHAARYKTRVVVVLHLWMSHYSTWTILEGGHLPVRALNAVICQPQFTGGSMSPTFCRRRNFTTCIFNMVFVGNEWLEQVLHEKLHFCLFGGCWACKKL